jgi:hypothetical protein
MHYNTDNMNEILNTCMLLALNTRNCRLQYCLFNIQYYILYSPMAKGEPRELWMKAPSRQH